MYALCQLSLLALDTIAIDYCMVVFQGPGFPRGVVKFSPVVETWAARRSSHQKYSCVL